jgi:hypothetical protein
MSVEPIPLLGGKSVYCINESQLREAYQLGQVDPETAPRIQAKLAELQSSLSRNEQAALAFLIIDRLLQSA